MWNIFVLQHSYTGSTSLDYSQMGVLTEMSEAEVLNSMMRSHDSMMAVLKSRHRSLQIIYSLWHNKDLKVDHLSDPRVEIYNCVRNIMRDVLISGRGGICSRDERLSNHRGSLGYSHIKTVRKLYIHPFQFNEALFFHCQVYFCSQSDVELGSMQLLTGSH